MTISGNVRVGGGASALAVQLLRETDVVRELNALHLRKVRIVWSLIPRRSRVQKLVENWARLSAGESVASPWQRRAASSKARKVESTGHSALLNDTGRLVGTRPVLQKSETASAFFSRPGSHSLPHPQRPSPLYLRQPDTLPSQLLLQLLCLEFPTPSAAQAAETPRSRCSFHFSA